MSDRRPALLVLLAVILVYLPELGGDWVWDDWVWKDQGAAALVDGLGRQVYGGIWRPLSTLSTMVVHVAWPDPLPHKVLNLLLHLVAVSAVAATARSLGARPVAAWAGAACFGLHPAVSETVCWVGGRTEILPATLLLVGIAAWSTGRRAVAAVCLGLAPFGKEAYVVAALSLAIWMWTRRRWDLPLLAGVAGGAVAYLVARGVVVGATIEGGDYALDPVPAFGAAALRGFVLLVDTAAADLWNPYAGAPGLGWAVLIGGPLAVVLARGRPALGAVMAALPPLVPSALAASSTLLLADRYYYVPFAGLGVAAGLGIEWAAARGQRSPVWALLALVPLALGVATARRSAEWRSELLLATSSWQRHPDNALAAEHYAYAEERWGRGCAAGLPAWRLAATLTPSGASGLQRCLVRTGAYAEALALTPSLRPTAEGALLAAEAATELGDLAAAERWARDAIAVDPTHTAPWVRLGFVLGLQGHTAEARAAVDEALRLDPADSDARTLRSLQEAE